MKQVTLTDFTSQEFAYLADMICEKLTDMGYDSATAEGFAFTLSVEFEEVQEDTQ